MSFWTGLTLLTQNTQNQGIYRMLGLSLFSGIGGLDLAFEQAGGRVIAMCEKDSFCRKVLHKHWPGVPVFEDVKELHGSDVGAVDVIYGGFPCQPFSVAGDRRGKDDARYLWPEFSRLVREIKPRWIVAENVPGILRIAADDVCSDLERQGYLNEFEGIINDYDGAAPEEVRKLKFIHERLYECYMLAKNFLEEINFND